jgi:hypothetical protein
MNILIAGQSSPVKCAVTGAKPPFESGCGCIASFVIGTMGAHELKATDVARLTILLDFADRVDICSWLLKLKDKRRRSEPGFFGGTRR